MFLCPYLTCPTVVPCGACVAPWHPHLGKIDGIDCMSARWTRSVETMTQWTWTIHLWSLAHRDFLTRWGKNFYSKEGCLHSILSYVFISFSCIFIFSSMLIYQFTRKTHHWTISGACQVDELSKRLQSSKDMVTKSLWRKTSCLSFWYVLVVFICFVVVCAEATVWQKITDMSGKEHTVGFWTTSKHVKMLTCQRETTRTISVAQPYSICIKMNVDGQGDDHGQLFHEVLAYPGGLSRHNQWKYHEIGSQLFFLTTLL